MLCSEMAGFLTRHVGPDAPSSVPVVLGGDFNSVACKRVPDVFDPKVSGGLARAGGAGVGARGGGAGPGPGVLVPGVFMACAVGMSSLGDGNGTQSQLPTRAAAPMTKFLLRPYPAQPFIDLCPHSPVLPVCRPPPLPQLPRDGQASGVYALLTRGSLPPSHPDHPASRRRPGEAANADFKGQPLTTSGIQLASSYVVAHGM